MKNNYLNHKNQKYYLLLFLSFIFQLIKSEAQTYWTNANNGPWQSYQVTGVPPQWPNTSATLSNWGNPINAWLNTGQFNDVRTKFPQNLKPQLNNFIWSIDSNSPRRTYYRLMHIRTDTSCKRAFIHSSSDEERNYM